MSKISLGLFVINALLILISIALMIPVAWWQWGCTMGLGMVCFRSWRAKVGRDDKMESLYGKYDRPSDGKPSEYHGL